MIENSLSEPVFLRNLVLYPISGGSENGFEPRTIDEIQKSRLGEFRETDTPDIGHVLFDNRGDQPVVMLDGEEIIGALQNRIITTSTIVEAHSTRTIPVVCVEEGRWDELGGFRTGCCSYPAIRSILATSRHKKIDTQQTIWAEIQRKITVSKTISQTSSMHDIYNTVENEIERYVEGFVSLNHNTVGFIGCAGKRILGLDLFQNPRLYRKFEHKLVRSYVLDAIEHGRGRTHLSPTVDEFFSRIQNTVRTLRFRMPHQKIKGRGFCGQACIYNKRLAHVSAFPV